MRRLTVLLLLLCATAAVAACGGDEKDDKPGGGKDTAGKPEKRQTLTQCLEGSGLEVERKDGNVIRAQDPEGDVTVDISTFPTGAEASEFANQLETPGTQAGRVVAVYSSNDVSPTKTDADKCLSKAS